MLKNGTTQDIANLPPPTFRNNANGTTVRARHHQSQLSVLYPHLQERRMREVEDRRVNDGGDGGEEDESSNVKI